MHACVEKLQLSGIQGLGLGLFGFVFLERETCQGFRELNSVQAWGAQVKV